MDSLTQIVLGAACGEAVLGKKIGNKALLFGAIGGTIPDLDVFIGALLYNNEIDAMLFHRGFMHSILFSILGAFLFGWISYKLYNTGKRVNTTAQTDWVKLFFWSLLTHPLLDCFTPYGTQLFAPFSNYRVAFNNIAVADPLYTVPFLLSIIVLMFYNRKSNKRKFWLKLGFGISSLYMVLTIVNKIYVDSVFKSSLSKINIDYIRFNSQPVILNNILWYGIAETKDNYHVGFYSLFDSSSHFSDWKKISKKRDLQKGDYKGFADLTWFSNGYYNVSKRDSLNFDYYDLRYPIISDSNTKTPIFSLKLFKDRERINMKAFEPNTGDFSKALALIWLRLKGK
ncbi:metal-dependent hydrolase [Winogradskyella sp.]|jgi:inner membrane protein|uniref:metal-dependent hydrolase n=1 Tax=Winogradskyella sp. TaxID=1883156 RepID=UPI0025D5066E|nr:metal-dependent hydrolase [Winogradskyella sp.]MCT4630024.1 metal-dependent hydrolase [Winogradskyella sp.]